MIFRNALRRFLPALPLAASLAAAAGANPDMTPYRTITQQQIRANLQLVVDRSGSMGLDMRGMCDNGSVSGGCNSERLSGNYMCMKSVRSGSTCRYYTCSGNACATTGNANWTTAFQTANAITCGTGTRYAWMYVGPSRLAILKNILGNTVSTRDTSTPAAPIWNTTAPVGTGPNYTSCGGTAKPVIPPLVAPGQIINGASTRVNLGLENYSSTTGGGNDAQNQVVMRTAAAVSTCERDAINALFKVSGTSTTLAAPCAGTYTALVNSNSTPTVAGLNLSRLVHRAVAFGESFTNVNICSAASAASVSFNTSGAIPADPQASCSRPRFNLLITDGASNQCNTNPAAGNNVSITYPACAGAPAMPNTNETPDAGSPAVITQALYNNGNNTGTAPGGNISVRTFVIGVSQDLSTPDSQQELRKNAYFGRTDASDPYGLQGARLLQGYDSAGNALVGITYPADPYLRTPTQYVLKDDTNSVGVTPAVTCFNNSASSKPDVCGGTGYVCTHAYNFNATNATALANALRSVFDATAAGDYTTETPTIAQGVTASSNGSANLVYTASSEFPSFYGHLRAQDLDQCVDATGALVNCTSTAAIGFRVIWDAGGALDARPAATRKIYTVDIRASSASLPVDADGIKYYPLVEISAANVAALQAIDSNARGGAPTGMSAAVIDFIRGNDGSGTPRAWKLGDIINSAPTVVRAPSGYSILPISAKHDVFAGAYSTRTQILLTGSSDGLVHAFDAGTGDETWAFLPPDMLNNQVILYNNYQLNPQQALGQVTDPFTHLFGVAAPMNVADVDLRAPDPNVTSNASDPVTAWRTVAVGTLGKGGRAIYALDVTHSWCQYNAATQSYTACNPAATPAPTADPNYAAYTGAVQNGGAPFKVLWYKNATSSNGEISGGFTGLGDTWSGGAIALDHYVVNAPTTPVATPVSGRWIASMGSGPDGANGNSGYTKGVAVYHLSMRNGALLAGTATTLGTMGSDSGLMAATMKANTVAYSVKNIDFQDLAADRYYQADTAGRLWEIDATNPGTPAWSNAVLYSDLNHPLYNAPAAGFYKDSYTGGSGRSIAILTWASGEFTDANTLINDTLCGTAGHPACFRARIFLSLRDVSPSPFVQIAGSNTTFCLNTAGCTVNITGYKSSPAASVIDRFYSPQSRVLGSPSLFIPVVLNRALNDVAEWPRASDINALFTVYDPTQGGCTGESSFLVIKPFGGADNATTGGGTAFGTTPTVSTAQYAASGVASSPVVYNGQIIMNVSSKYSFAAARIAGTSGFTTAGGNTPYLASWREIF